MESSTYKYTFYTTVPFSFFFPTHRKKGNNRPCKAKHVLAFVLPSDRIVLLLVAHRDTKTVQSQLTPLAFVIHLPANYHPSNIISFLYKLAITTFQPFQKPHKDHKEHMHNIASEHGQLHQIHRMSTKSSSLSQLLVNSQ